MDWPYIKLVRLGQPEQAALAFLLNKGRIRVDDVLDKFGARAIEVQDPGDGVFVDLLADTDTPLSEFSFEPYKTYVVKVTPKADSLPQYFIQPKVQTQLRAATFIIPGDAADVQPCADDAAASEDALSRDLGMGIFFSARRAVTANKDLPREWPTGHRISVLFPATRKELEVTLVQRHQGFGFAILQADSDQDFLPASPAPASSLKDSNLVLALFFSHLADCLPWLYRLLGFVPATGVSSSLHDQYVFFKSMCDSPAEAAVLLKDECLVGLVLGDVDALWERLERKRVAEGLAEPEETLDAFVSGIFERGCIAIAASVFAS